jgi:hypothetical protein
MDEKLPFKVIEFNKEAKRIILSHSRVFEDEQKNAKRKESGGEKKARPNRKEPVENIDLNVEKTTLGDIEELAALRDRMTEEKKPKAARKSKAAKKKPAEAEPEAVNSAEEINPVEEACPIAEVEVEEASPVAEMAEVAEATEAAEVKPEEAVPAEEEAPKAEE